MRQLTERVRPWAPTMLASGLLATLAESVAERDVTSIVLVLMALVGAGFVVRAHRGLTRGEVRAEIQVGIRALVRPEALHNPPRTVTVEDPERTIDFPRL